MLCAVVTECAMPVWHVLPPPNLEEEERRGALFHSGHDKF